MKRTSPSLSIVIPAYNEAQRLPASLQRVLAWIDASGRQVEVIVVDDGSSDDTVAVVEALAAADGRLRALSLGRNRGKGAAVRRGVEAAQNDLVLFSDADLSTPIEEVDKLAAVIATGVDVAIGSRDVRDSHIEEHQPWYREAMGRSFNRIVQTLALPGIKDTQCGFKLFTAEAAHAAFDHMSIEGFAFDVEVLFIARRLGFSIVEVGVRWINDERTTVDPVWDSARMFADVMQVRFRQRGLRRKRR